MTGGPQDARVDRRDFLRRMGALTAAVAAGGTLPAPAGAAPRRPSGTPDPDTWFRSLPRGGLSGTDAPTHPMDFPAWELGALIRDGALTPTEVVAGALERIRRWEPVYRAFNTVLEEESMTRARELDGIRPSGLLHGIPLAVKDNYHTAGVRTTANSWIFQDFIPERDSAAVARLGEAGGVVLGKTQMGPLATTRALTPDGEITTVSAWAPGDPGVSPGGSSSGSATAVAGRLATSSIGTQTGGSITVPSLAQGLTGLKPTMGRVSLRGVIPLSYTRDHPGPLARDARDAALLLQAMAGADPEDPRTLGLPPVPDYLLAATPVTAHGRPALRWPTRIGVLPGWADGSGERGHARRAFLTAMEELGARLVHVTLPPAFDELTSFAFNNVRLPERSEPFLRYLREDVRLFGVALSSWINGLLLSGDEYLKGQRAKLALLRVVLDDLFRDCDVVVQPGHVPFDMIGLPLIALPVGLRARGGEAPGGGPDGASREGAGGPDGATLPEGILLGGLPFGEERLLAVAAAWQSVTDWHTRRPPDPTPSQEARLIRGGAEARGRLDVEEVAGLSE
jgi:Asp-tRNA(Asn)/Glu-tRNA(Gln) amidotransferase A subunit family amidase